MTQREMAIRVQGVGKRFYLRAGGGQTLKTRVLDALRPGRRGREFWALRDISFEVERGRTLGIIGANGAGKSTLLSLLAGTKQPTTGSVETRGSISSLLELGAGFHPDLTGRENIYLAGAIMGLSRRQMRARFDAIVAFAGIEDFIDQPVRHYSSGMYVRLGFAVAVEVDPDILLIDEVLAVGDTAFQRKCIEKMAAFRHAGKTMLLISHDLNTIQSISDTILVLNEGRIAGLGEPGQMVADYKSLSRSRAARGLQREWGTGEARIVGVEVRNAAGEPAEAFRWGERLQARIRYESSRRIENPVFGFAIADSGGRVVYGNNTQIEKFTIPHIEGAGAVTLWVNQLSMAPGSYLLSFSLHSADHTINYHRLDNVAPIAVQGDREFEGCYMPCQWGIE